MRIGSYLFGWALLSLTAISCAQENDNEQQFCPSAEELFTNPDYQATDCILTDFVDDCGGCPVTLTEELVGDERGIDCYTAEEQLCPTIRCCEQCWTKLQNFLQCFVVEPNWKSNMGGMIEDGCVLDCSRFPIGGDSDSPTDDDENDDDAPPLDPPEPPDSPIADTTNSESSSANDGIYIRDEEFLEECRNARNNMMCQIENCPECGDDGYPSLAATQLEGIQEVGSFYTCGQMEEALCPEIRCCKEKCDYKLSEFWFQCNVVESAKDLGRTDTSCTIDCWDGDDNSLDVSDKSEDAASVTSNGNGEDEEEDLGLLENGEDSSDTGSSSGTFLAKPMLWKAVMVVMIGSQTAIV